MREIAVFYYAEIDGQQTLKPAYYLYPPPADAELRAPGRIAHTCTVRDARSLVEPPQLDEEGFVFLRQSTDVDFFNGDAVREEYFPQVEALVREHKTRC